MHPLLMACAVILLAASLVVSALGLLRRDHLRERSDAVVSSVLEPGRRRQGTATDDRPEATHGWIAWLEAFGAHLRDSRIESLLLTPEDRLLLDQCSHDTTRGRTVFLALRVVLGVALPSLALILLHPSGTSGLVTTILIAAGAGLLLPKFALRAWAARLARHVAEELPLLIDLLRMLQGIGLSMDQSLHTVAEQFQDSMPVLGRELHIANDLYARGRDREQSLRRLADLYGGEDLRSLARLIAQVDRHGGAVQEPLRLFGERLREQRKLRMKDAVGKLSVKMTVVMMLTLLPALMLVLAGPAIIALTGAVSKLGAH